MITKCRICASLLHLDMFPDTRVNNSFTDHSAGVKMHELFWRVLKIYTDAKMLKSFRGRDRADMSIPILHYYDVIMKERNGVSNHQCFDCLLSCLFRRKSKKTSNLRVAGIFEGNSPVTGEFTGELPAQRASDAESVSIWWRHHELKKHNVTQRDIELAP